MIRYSYTNLENVQLILTCPQNHLKAIRKVVFRRNRQRTIILNELRQMLNWILTDELQVSNDPVHIILRHHLNKSNICFRFFPGSLIENKKKCKFVTMVCLNPNWHMMLLPLQYFASKNRVPISCRLYFFSPKSIPNETFVKYGLDENIWYFKICFKLNLMSM